jgi:hypothetical protein
MSAQCCFNCCGYTQHLGRAFADTDTGSEWRIEKYLPDPPAFEPSDFAFPIYF